MTESQARFIELMRRCKHKEKLSVFFDQHNRLCDLKVARKAIRGTTLNKAEKVMLSFFINIWIGTDELKFSITDAAGMLQEQDRQLIVGWLNRPFWMEGAYRE